MNVTRIMIKRSSLSELTLIVRNTFDDRKSHLVNNVIRVIKTGRNSNLNEKDSMNE